MYTYCSVDALSSRKCVWSGITPSTIVKDAASCKWFGIELPQLYPLMENKHLRTIGRHLCIKTLLAWFKKIKHAVQAVILNEETEGPMVYSFTSPIIKAKLKPTTPVKDNYHPLSRTVESGGTMHYSCMRITTSRALKIRNLESGYPVISRIVVMLVSTLVSLLSMSNPPLSTLY